MNIQTRHLLWVMGLSWLFMAFSTESSSYAPHPSLTFTSGPNQTALLEMYSSEGCSSCPPADEWFTGLQKSPDLWKTFVPVCFHVNYWDELGWKDELGSKEFTQRQKIYAMVWKTKSIYTPEFYVNGKEWRSWFQKQELPQFPKTPAGALKVERMTPDYFSVTFVPEHSNAKVSWWAHFALLGFGIEKQILAGENAGKTLRHDFVVLDHQEQECLKTAAGFATQFTIDRDKIEADQGSYAIAIWMTEDNSMIPVQAAGGYLPREKRS